MTKTKPAGSKQSEGRRSLLIAEDLWQRITHSALMEGVKTGRGVSVSHWLRDAAEFKLGKRGE